MEYKLMYELTSDWYRVIIRTCVFWVISIFFIINIIIFAKKHAKSFAWISTMAVSCAVGLVFLLCAISSIVGNVQEMEMLKCYKRGQYETVEGIIQMKDYASKHNGLDEFEIGNENFTTGQIIEIGYIKTVARGSPLKDGALAKIGFIYDEVQRRNVIVRVEVVVFDSGIDSRII